jgi:hypothetical protein
MGRFVDASTCLQDKRDEVVLVGVLRRIDRGVGLRRMSRRGATALVDIALGPGAHHADVDDPRIAVLADLPWYVHTGNIIVRTFVRTCVVRTQYKYMVRTTYLYNIISQTA